MKKFLSLFLSIVMLFSITSGIETSFYANESLAYDEVINGASDEPIGTFYAGFNKNLKLQFNGTVLYFYYDFTPKETGLYELSVDFLSENMECAIHIFQNDNLLGSINGSDGKNVTYYCKDEKYRIDFSFFIKDDEIIFDDDGMAIKFPEKYVNIALNKHLPDKISIDEEKIFEVTNVQQEMQYYSFVPGESGLYRFVCTGICEDDNVVAFLFDENMNQINNAIDFDGDSCFFDFNCEKNKTYIFAGKFQKYYGGLENSSMIMSVKKHIHNYSKHITKPSCIKGGYTTYTCSECGDVIIDNYTPKTGHTYKNVITKATLNKNGKIDNKCSVCGKISKTTSINYVKTIKLNRNTFTTNGKVQRPSVTVYDSKGKQLTYKKDFIVDYSNWSSKNVGRYTVTVKMIGNYSGTKTFPYYINPKPTEFVPSNKGGFKAISKGFTLKWNKQASQTTGYQIQYATKRDFSNAATITIANPNTTSYTSRGRAGNKRYYVRVRTYKKIGNGTFYSNWNSGVKSVVTLR